jgi:hypothetical protein
MIPSDFGLGTVALALLVFPGWLAARATGLRQPLLAGFIASVVALLGVVLALNALSVRLTFGHCGTAWLTLILVVVWLSRKQIRQPPAPSGGVISPFAWREHRPLFIALLPAMAVVVYRASTQALFGIDTVFRWNYLAAQMFTRGTLGFYPPVSAADYEIYAWPDGIAPAVSTLYFWIYSLAHNLRPALTAPLVIFQFCLGVIAAFALARRYFSDRAAAFTCALLACSPVIAWATAMGQETGLTAIGLLGLLLYLPRTRGEETRSGVVFAALAAALGALAREYGLVFPLFGVALISARRLSWRTVIIFTSVTAIAVVPWYARNWMRTGNPLFNFDIHGWFPINQEHAWLNESYQVEFAWGKLPAGATRYVLGNCLAVLVTGTAGALLYFRKARALVAAIALIVLLWIASVGYTAAGFTNALRVLSPGLVLGVVLGGAACARWVPKQRYLAGASVALSLFAVDAALRALTLPGNVYKIPPAEWLTAGRAVHDYHDRAIYRELVRVASGERILVLGPNALLTSLGGRTLPLWSPEMRFLFDDQLEAKEIVRRLHASGVGFVLLNRGPANERYLARSRFFRNPNGTLRPVWVDEEMVFHHVEDIP